MQSLCDYMPQRAAGRGRHRGRTGCGTAGGTAPGNGAAPEAGPEGQGSSASVLCAGLAAVPLPCPVVVVSV